jgi:hypothetical protein
MVKVGQCGRHAGSKKGPDRHFADERRLYSSVIVFANVYCVHGISVPERCGVGRQRASHLELFC